MKPDLRVAIVQDALPFVGGAERVLEAVLEIYPDAPIYTLVFNPKAFEQTLFACKTVHTSFVNRLPGAHRNHRRYLPIYPLAIEQFDLRDFDIILSFSYAVAHGVIPRPDQLHISLVYTPLRHAWHFYQQYLYQNSLSSGPRSWMIRVLLHYYRMWNRTAVERVDTFVAISGWIRRCIWRAYRRPAQVIYPPVDLDRFHPAKTREQYYLTISRFSPHKKVDLIVNAFAKMQLPLIVIGDGVQFNKVKNIGAPNITFLGRQPDHIVEELLSKAKGLVHAAEEDFGIVLVEAQAAGCPVIAYGEGGALETVIPEKTGLFFKEQTVDSLIKAIVQFENLVQNFNSPDLLKNASRFSKERFQREFANLVASEWELHTGMHG